MGEGAGACTRSSTIASSKPSMPALSKVWMTAARAWAVVMARVGLGEVRGKGEDEGHVPRGRCVRLPQDAKLLRGYSPGCEGEGEEKGDGAGEEKRWR